MEDHANLFQSFGFEALGRSQIFYLTSVIMVFPMIVILYLVLKCKKYQHKVKQERIQQAWDAKQNAAKKKDWSILNLGV